MCVCVCVNVSVLVSVSVWKCEERRCGVVTLKSPKKKHILKSLSLSNCQKQNHKTNGSLTLIL